MMEWELLPHPPYNEYLAPSDFQLFGPLKVSLGGLKFEDDQQHVLKFFHTNDKDFYATGFRRLVECKELVLELTERPSYVIGAVDVCNTDVNFRKTFFLKWRI